MHSPVEGTITGSNPVSPANLCLVSSAVEQRSYKPNVGSSILSRGTNNALLYDYGDRPGCRPGALGLSGFDSYATHQL